LGLGWLIRVIHRIIVKNAEIEPLPPLLLLQIRNFVALDL
jgi:hypothetical protein